MARVITCQVIAEGGAVGEGGAVQRGLAVVEAEGFWNRGVVALAAHVLQYLEAADSRQHDVENDEIQTALGNADLLPAESVV